MDANDPPTTIAASRAASDLVIDVIRKSDGWTGAIDDAALDEALRLAAMTAMEQSGPCEVCVVLATDQDVQALNASWRSKDQPTNVLSFPHDAPQQDGMPRHLGDIVLGLETVQREADERNLPIGHHVTHLVVHGFLHLLGLDHETDDEADKMEGMEARILLKLGLHDPRDFIMELAQETGAVG